MTEQPIQQSKKTRLLMNVMSENGLILGLFALVSTGLTAVTYVLTKGKIAQEIERSLIRQLSELVPTNSYTNDVYQDCLIVQDKNLLGSAQEQKLYRMRNQQENHALMLTTVAPDGYSGKITLSVAVESSGKLLGINILSHNETPGLGDKIERTKSNWVHQFNNLSLSNTDETEWTVKKDGGQFDALTGATITPRAVIKSVFKSLQFLQSNQQQFFELPSDCYPIEVDKK